MTDKDKIQQLEKNLAICRKMVKEQALLISALRQEVAMQNDEINRTKKDCK